MENELERLKKELCEAKALIFALKENLQFLKKNCLKAIEIEFGNPYRFECTRKQKRKELLKKWNMDEEKKKC